MAGFSVAQQSPGEGSRLAGAVVWRTCVREIALIDRDSDLPPGARIWHDEDAYAHLLEVVCGLDSPIVGETQVLHQFKLFADAISPADREWRELCRVVLGDARTIRARHLTGLGSRSYGSAVRRHVRTCAQVAVIGTGMLAQELLPFVADDGRRVDVWGRRETSPIPLRSATYRRVGDTGREPSHGSCALVVAAPISSAGIADIAANYQVLALIVDLRAEEALDPPPPIAPVVTLAEVFAEFDRAATLTSARVAAARQEVRRCAHAFANRVKLNPSGWHDLCA